MNYEAFRRVNVDRSIVCFKMPLESVTLLRWALYTAGEAGEVLNAEKKVHHDPTNPARRVELGIEIADMLIYGDLALACADQGPVGSPEDREEARLSEIFPELDMDPANLCRLINEYSAEFVRWANKVMRVSHRGSLQPSKRVLSQLMKVLWMLGEELLKAYSFEQTLEEFVKISFINRNARFGYEMKEDPFGTKS